MLDILDNVCYHYKLQLYVLLQNSICAIFCYYEVYCARNW